MYLTVTLSIIGAADGQTFAGALPMFIAVLMVDISLSLSYGVTSGVFAGFVLMGVSAISRVKCGTVQ